MNGWVFLDGKAVANGRAPEFVDRTGRHLRAKPSTELGQGKQPASSDTERDATALIPIAPRR